MFSRTQKIALLLAATCYVLAGVMHFVKTEAYLRIMPPYVPWHLAMVQISGVCEIAGGIGLLIPQLRTAATWGLIAVLISVFPANVYMATNPMGAGAASISPIFLLGRLLLQPLLVWWLLWCTRPGRIGG
jgi:uncharacterized membrane protein